MKLVTSIKSISLLFITFLSFAPASYAADSELLNLDITTSLPAIIALMVFALAYMFVMAEEYTHLRKSKPVVVAAGIIWAIVAYMAVKMGFDTHSASYAFKHTFLEFAELFGFLLVAMTFINTMTERNVFESLRSWLVGQGFTFRKIFWITGVQSFFMSPIADNLTTALIMCAVVMAVGKNNTKFIGLACINIVVAANAGGAFSPFGDITTLMVCKRVLLHLLNSFIYLFHQ